MSLEEQSTPSASQFSQLSLQRIQQMKSERVENITRQLKRCRSRLSVHLDDSGRHLVGFQLCRSRWCCYCDVGRSRKIKARLADRMHQDEQHSQYMMLNINVAHTDGETIDEVFDRLRGGYQSLRHRNGWKNNVAAYLQKLDIGLAHRASPHPHFHVLLKLKPGVDKGDAYAELHEAFSQMKADKGICADMNISVLESDEWLDNTIEYISDSWLTFNEERGLGHALTSMAEEKVEELMIFMNRRRVHDFGGEWRGLDQGTKSAAREELVEMPFSASCDSEIFIQAAYAATTEKSVERVKSVFSFITKLRVRAEMYARPSLAHKLVCTERALSKRLDELLGVAHGP